MKQEEIRTSTKLFILSDEYFVETRIMVNPNDEDPTVSVGLSKDGGRHYGLFYQLFRVKPWTLFKFSQKMSDVAFLAIKGGINKHYFILGEDLRIFLDFDPISQEILLTIEFFEEYRTLRFRPLIVHKLAKCLAETALVAYSKQRNRVAMIENHAEASDGGWRAKGDVEGGESY